MAVDIASLIAATGGGGLERQARRQPMVVGRSAVSGGSGGGDDDAVLTQFTCPLCQTVLSGYDGQAQEIHVNRCLDRMEAGDEGGEGGGAVVEQEAGCARQDATPARTITTTATTTTTPPFTVLPHSITSPALPEPIKDELKEEPLDDFPCSPGPDEGEGGEGGTELKNFPMADSCDMALEMDAFEEDEKKEWDDFFDPATQGGDDLACLQGQSDKNAFKAIMQGNQESQRWSEAAAAEAQSGRYRTPPFYKIMQGIPHMAVDAFRYGKIPGVTAYFLTHFHSDHYTSLSGSWSHGPIYCTQTTANLVRLQLNVKPEWVHVIPLDTPVMVDGVQVTFLDANHCPGSVLILLQAKRRGGRPWRVLHCGDFRAHPKQVLHPALEDNWLDVLYLDTTYLNPKHNFPAQEIVVDACAALVHEKLVVDRTERQKDLNLDFSKSEDDPGSQMLKGWLTKREIKMETLVKEQGPTGKTMILIGTYSIGKEKIVKGMARALGSKIYVTEYKRRIYNCLKDNDLHDLLTDNPLEAQVHVTNLFAIKAETLDEYLQGFKPTFTSILGFRPTGWTYRGPPILAPPSVQSVIENPTGFDRAWFKPTRDSNRTVACYGVPYSEHSSFRELTCFIMSLNVRKIIPTVNCGSARSRDQMKSWFERWDKEKKRIGRTKVTVVPFPCVDHW